MFITFTVSVLGHETSKVELLVSSKEEAKTTAYLLETSDKVNCFTMSPVTPEDMGMKPNSSWEKFKS